MFLALPVMKSLLQLLNAGCVAVTAIDINKYMCGMFY